MLMDRIKGKFPKSAFTSREADELGISARMLTHLVKTGEIQRISRGLYSLAGVQPSGDDWRFYDLATTASSYKDAVICLISALSYWEITEEFARSFWLAFPNNHPPIKNPMVRMFRPRNLELGVIKIQLSDVEVKITDPERSIVDAFKYLDEESSVTSLRMYLNQEESKINVVKLVNYAVALKEFKLIKILKEIASAQAKSYPSLNEKAFRETIKAMSKIRSHV
jgi:predicted transcriptional regulator of viral defense system